MILAPSSEPWTAGALDERALRRLQDRLHVVDAENVLLDKNLEVAMAIAPPTMAVPSGRLKDAFDMMELPKSARSAIALERKRPMRPEKRRWQDT